MAEKLAAQNHDYTSCIMHKFAMWEVATARISVLLFISRKIIKSYSGSLIKLFRSNLFHLYFIEKNIIRILMEGSLREVIGN